MKNEHLERILRLMFVCGGLGLVVTSALILLTGWSDGLLLGVVALVKGKPPLPHWLGILHSIAAQGLVAGALLAGFGSLMGMKWKPAIPLIADKTVILSATVLVSSALWLPSALFEHSAIIDGERYWWLFDDAMISMRYGRNLAHGIGLVWNPGERVEGYSNLLWTLYMALVHLMPIPDSATSLIVLLTNVLIGLATIPILYAIVQLLGGGTLPTVATLLAFALSTDYMIWALSGIETCLLTFAVLFGTYRVLQDARTGRVKLSTCLLIGTISLIRADAIILAALLYAEYWVVSRNKNQVLYYTAIALLIPAASELFRILYYGDVLPNTAYLKAMYWDDRLFAGLEYVKNFGRTYSVLIASAVVGAFLVRGLYFRLVLAASALYVAYVAYIGGDAFDNFRFMIPVLPLLMALGFLGIHRLHLYAAPRLALTAACLLMIPASLPGLTAYNPDPRYIGNVEMGLILRQNTRPDSKVADFWAGTVLYYSERYAVDLLGKSDRHIAHMPVVSTGMRAGHNKFDFEYSLGMLKPDFVIANFKIPVSDEEMLRVSTGDWAGTGQLYFNSTFREHCLPYPVFPETWRSIFRCDWAFQARRVSE